MRHLVRLYTLGQSSSCLRTSVRSLSGHSSKLEQQLAASNITRQQAHEQPWTSANRRLTNKLEIIEPNDKAPVAEFRVLNEEGYLVGDLDPELDNDKILQLYKGMLQLNTMDQVMFDSQRQGRITFYMTSIGEEATQFGAAGALKPVDWIYVQYREPGLLLHRGFSFREFLSQCYGNIHDLGKGRQMPIHYGSRELNYVTLSSPLSTQMPQAVGSAYALRLKAQAETGSATNSPVVACFFGEGAASEGDAHAAMNFAATLSCPVLFFCRNNGYAISTPVSEQMRGDGIVWRGLGYGMPALRVDGNDLFAVYTATRVARELSVRESRPVLLEMMTYRLGHHSTSDDSNAYRSADEISAYESSGPIQRVYKYLMNSGLWSKQQDEDHRKETRAQVLEALSWAEREKKPAISSMFEDVYSELPKHLSRQREDLRTHLSKYSEHYPIKEHDGF